LRLKILGSAAAEGTPALFCVCDVCKRARERGGKDLRRRTSYLLDDSIMVDWGPDAYSSMLAFGVDYSGLRHLLITHSHPDHWAPADLQYRREGFAVLPPGSWLTIHGNRKVGESLACLLGADGGLDSYALRFDQVGWGDVRELSDGVVVECLKAAHAPEEEALNFLFTVAGRHCLIGNDTGPWPDETWRRLSEVTLDVVILDSTSGLLPAGRYHHNAQGVVATRNELMKLGSLAAGAVFVANHFSHNGGMNHDDLERFFSPHDILVGYDGMELQI